MIFIEAGMAIGGAIIGGLGGLKANAARAQEARYQQMIARAQYEAQKAQMEAQKSILEGNLSVASMDSNTARRQAAMQESAQRAESRQAAGTSGTDAGTPFYMLDKQAFEGIRALQEIDYKAWMNNEQVARQYTAGMKGMEGQLLASEIGMLQINEDMRYLEGPVAAALSAGSGAFSGAAAGNSLTNMMYSMGIMTEATSGAVDKGIQSLFGATPKEGGMGAGAFQMGLAESSVLFGTQPFQAATPPLQFAPISPAPVFPSVFQPQRPMNPVDFNFNQQALTQPRFNMNLMGNLGQVPTLLNM